MKQTKTLYIQRHAKAERGPDDAKRPLAPRGIEDARHMGKYLAVHGIKPDKILCSTSRRTKETFEYLSLKGNIEYTDRLYLASANELLGMVAKIPESVHSLMLIGHNPGLQELCLKLAKHGDETLLEQLIAKFPTCGLATIAFDGAWRDIGRAHATLAGFISPKMLKD